MKPKAYFVVHMVALVLLVVVLLITTVFLISYSLFSISASGHLMLLGFGWRGVYAFFMLFPWITFSIEIILLIILDALLRRFRAGYHRPIAFVFFGTTVVLVCIGYVVSVTSLHGSLLQRAEHRQLPHAMGPVGPVVGPFVQPMYDHMRISHRADGVIQGTVTSITETTFTVMHDEYDTDLQDATTTIVAPAHVRLTDFLHVGDHVIVAGDVLPSGDVQAYGVTRFAQR